MSYVVYHKKSKLILDFKSYKSAAAAKAALTRALKANPSLNREDFAVAEHGVFEAE